MGSIWPLYSEQFFFSELLKVTLTSLNENLSSVKLVFKVSASKLLFLEDRVVLISALVILW
jgi:hypothetical protein